MKTQVLTTSGIRVLSDVNIPGDITNYGAVADATGGAGTHDCIAAFEAAIATDGQVYVPNAPGAAYYISRPICVPQATVFRGDGQLKSLIGIGTGDPTTNPSRVQSFGGPLIYITAPNFTDYPSYGGPLVGVSGKSLLIDSTKTLIYLHDAWPWSGQWYYYTQLALRCWTKVNSVPFLEAPILGSRGPLNNGPTGNGSTDIAYGFYAVPSGGNIVFRAYFTTDGQGQQHIDSPAFAPGVAHNLELDWNGSAFDFYVDGVNAGHLTATGKFIQIPWEGVTIGFGGPEFNCNTTPIDGALDSIEFSQVARHTGTGSFTPPVAKYVADSNTVALINFDQDALCPAGQPFLMGQVKNLGAGLVPHYARIFLESGDFSVGLKYAGDCDLHDFSFICSDSFGGNAYAAGIIGAACPRTSIKRVRGQVVTSSGLNIIDLDSFYSFIEDVRIERAFGFGVLAFVITATRIQTQGCGISQQYTSGQITSCTDQPAFNFTIFPFVFGGSGLGLFGSVNVSFCAADTEGTFATMRAAAILLEGIGAFTSTNNGWLLGGTGAVPAFIYSALPAGGAMHINDRFYTSANTTCLAFMNGSLADKVRFDNCAQIGPTTVPLSNVDGFVIQYNQGHETNQAGLSISDVPASNLVGTFQVIHGSGGIGGARFLTHEANGDYEVVVQYKSHTGSAPAANSTVVTGYTTSGSGFTVSFAADPGGTCTLTFSYMLIRRQPNALLNVPLPSVPTSFANPLAGSPVNTDFAVGITLRPTTGHTFRYDNTVGALQYAVMAGTAAPNFWAIGMVQDGAAATVRMASAGGELDSFVGTDGNLGGVLHPGAHNIIIANIAGNFQTYTDAIPLATSFGVSFGSQPANLYVGQDSLGGNTMTSAALTDLKVDRLASRVYTSVPDYGPLGKPECAFYGDQMTMGLNAGTGGGWATQLAETRYSLKYFWFATTSSALASDLASTFWAQWGVNQTSQTQICIAGGFNDLLVNSATATDTMGWLREVIEGPRASAIFNPPTSNAAGTATCVINGVSFNATFSVDADTTVNNLIALINADAPTATLVTPTLFFHTLKIIRTTFGTAGNGLPLAGNGLNGSGWRTSTTVGGMKGAIAVGIPNIVFCNVPPFGNAVGFTAGKETQRVALNALINAYTGTGVVIADVDTTLRDPANHQNILPAYLSADNTNPNNAGHTALLGLLGPLLP